MSLVNIELEEPMLIGLYLLASLVGLFPMEPVKKPDGALLLIRVFSGNASPKSCKATILRIFAVLLTRLVAHTSTRTIWTLLRI